MPLLFHVKVVPDTILTGPANTIAVKALIENIPPETVVIVTPAATVPAAVKARVPVTEMVEAVPPIPPVLPDVKVPEVIVRPALNVGVPVEDDVKVPPLIVTSAPKVVATPVAESVFAPAFKFIAPLRVAPAETPSDPPALTVIGFATVIAAETVNAAVAVIKPVPG